MTIENPKALFWALLVVPIVLLYLRGERLRRQPVSTGFLWEQVLRGSPGTSGWWRYRRLVSLGVQCAGLGLLVLAMVQPHRRPPERIVVLLDNSATMNATDETPCRLEAAKGRIAAWLPQLRSSDQIALVTAGHSPNVCCAMTGRKADLARPLKAVRPTPGPARLEEAVALARLLLESNAGDADNAGDASNAGGRIVLLTDRHIDRGRRRTIGGDVEVVGIGGPAINFGITRLEARRTPPDFLGCQVLVEVTSFSDLPGSLRLEVILDGEPVETVPVRLDASARWSHIFDVHSNSSSGAGRLVARLGDGDTPSADALPDDNRATLVLPPHPKHGLQATAPEEADRILISPCDLRDRAGLSRSPGSPRMGQAGPSLWILAVVAFVAILALEWPLFHRRWLV